MFPFTSTEINALAVFCWCSGGPRRLVVGRVHRSDGRATHLPSKYTSEGLSAAAQLSNSLILHPADVLGNIFFPILGRSRPASSRLARRSPLGWSRSLGRVGRLLCVALQLVRVVENYPG